MKLKILLKIAYLITLFTLIGFETNSQSNKTKIAVNNQKLANTSFVVQFPI